jgi:hypothetical protein
MRIVAAAALLLVIAGIALRVAASATELWQDEIWSLWLLHDLASPIQILTSIHHDNNHPINSLFLYLLGDHRDCLTYRLLSLVTGTASILLAGVIALRRSLLEALTTMILFSASFLMVLYSSEARGYMPAVFFALLAFWAARGYRDRGGLLGPLLFGLSVVLGFLSHLTFLFTYLALAQWMLAKKAPLTELLRWHALPLGFLAAFCFLDVRYLHYGGVYEPISLLRSLRESIALPLGLPDTSAGLVVGVGFSVAMVLSGLRAMRRSGDDEWAFYVTALSAPAAVLIAVGIALHIWFPRYALVSIAFFYLLLASVLSRQYRASAAGKILYVTVLLVFCFGNGWRNVRLVEGGRGRYLEALSYLAGESRGDAIRVAGSHDASISTLLWFYGQRIPGKHFSYVAEAERSTAPAPWFILTTQASDYVPDYTLVVSGHAYTFQRAYDCFTSCYRWFVYRETPPRRSAAPILQDRLVSDHPRSVARAS